LPDEKNLEKIKKKKIEWLNLAGGRLLKQAPDG
jgi:hypothetical protein